MTPINISIINKKIDDYVYLTICQNMYIFFNAEGKFDDYNVGTNARPRAKNDYARITFSIWLNTFKGDVKNDSFSAGHLKILGEVTRYIAKVFGFNMEVSAKYMIDFFSDSKYVRYIELVEKSYGFSMFFI
jgi:hypothetical protein